MDERYTDRCANPNCPRGGVPLTVLADANVASPKQIETLDEIERVSLQLLRLVRKASVDSEIIQTAVDAQKLVLAYGRTLPRRPV